MNHLMLAGHLGADPEVRFTPKGQKVTTLRLATNSKRSGKEETTWWRVTLWGETFDKLMTYMKKGSSVVVYGELQKPEIFNDREGRPQVSLNVTAYQITFSPFGRSGNSEEGGHQPAQNHQATSTPAFAGAGAKERGQKNNFSEASFGSGGFDSYGNDSFFGQGQSNDHFDEEIPF